MTAPQPAPGLHRRTLMRTAAWSAPAVTFAAMAPAFAGSNCTTASHTIVWSTARWNPTMSNQNATSGTIDAVSSNNAPTVTLTVSRQLFGNTVASSQWQGLFQTRLQNMQVSPYNVGSTGARGLTLLQQQTRAGSTPVGNQNHHDHRQTVTFSFSTSVKNLRVTITDIDNNWNGGNNDSQRQYRDRVYVSGSPAATKASASTLLGSGTQDDPWRRDPLHKDVDNTNSDQGNVTLQYDSTALSTVTVTYYNGYDRPLVGNGQHAIWISGMTFDAAC